MKFNIQFERGIESEFAIFASLGKLEINCFSFFNLYDFFFGIMCRSMLSKLWRAHIWTRQQRHMRERENKRRQIFINKIYYDISLHQWCWIINHVFCRTLYFLPCLSLSLSFFLSSTLLYSSLKKTLVVVKDIIIWKFSSCGFLAVAVCKTKQKLGIVNRNFH